MTLAPARCAGAAALCVALAGGCTVGEPDAHDWTDHARQSLDDVASEVATARMTVVQLDEGRLPVSYGVTVLADSEQAVSTAEEGLSSLQPPQGLGDRTDQVLALIGRAADAVRRAREAVVAGHYHLPSLVAALDRLHTALDRRRAQL